MMRLLKQALTFEHRSSPSYVYEILVDYKGGYFNSKAEKKSCVKQHRISL